MGKNSIRKQLVFAFVALAIAPLMLLGVVLCWYSFVVQLEQAKELQRAVSKAALNKILVLPHHMGDELLQAADISNLMELDHHLQNSVLSRLRSYKHEQHRDIINELTLLDSIGREIAQVSRISIITATDLGERSKADEFVIPKMKHEIYFSPVSFDKETGEPLMSMSLPVINPANKSADGVLVAQIRLKEIWNSITDMRVGEKGSVYIVDQDGRVVAHQNPSVMLRGSHITRPLGKSGIDVSLDGTRVLQADEKFQLGSQTFYVVTERPLAEALDLTLRTIFTISALLCVAIAGTIVLGFLARRRIVQPVEILANTAEKIAAGDLSVKAEVLQDDELGTLAEAFNAMTTQLTDTIDSLEEEIAEHKQAREELRKHRQNLEELVKKRTDKLAIANRQLQREIGEREQAQERTELVYAELNQIFQTATDGIRVIDKDFNVLRVSKTFAILSGRSEAQLVGKKCSEGFPGPMCHTPQCPLSRILTGEERVECEVEKERSDRTKVPCIVTATPFRGPAGDLIGIVENFKDLTDRKQAEEQIISLAKFPDENPNPVLRVSKDGNILYVNETASPLLNLWECQVNQPLPDECRKVVLDVVSSGSSKETEVECEGRIYSLTFTSVIDEEYVNVYGLDITERIRVEEELTKSERFLSATEQIAKVGGWEIDEKTKKVFWTKEIYNITEVPNDYDPSSLEKEAIAFFSAEDQLILDKAIQRAFEHNEPYDMEFQITTAKGNKKWAQAICEPIVLDGQVVKLGGTFQDITERHQAEERLRENEEKYRDLYDNAPVMYHTIDLKGIVLECNQTEADMLGYSKEEIIGKPIHALETKEYQDLAPHALSEATEKGHISGERRFVKKDGTIIYTAFDSTAIYDDSGQVVGFRSTLTDISHLKQAEEALRKSEKKFRTLFNNAGDAIFIRDDEGHFLEVNQVACDRLGYTREELLQMTPMDLDTLEYAEKVRERTKQILEGHIIFKTVHVSKDGRLIPTEMSSRTIDYEGQQAIMTIARDISERKKAEEQIKASLKEKEVLLRELYHRTKNNMQVIIAILNMQSPKIKDEAALQVIEETGNRIRTMALVHEKLYQTKNLSKIDLKEYANDLLSLLMRSYETASGRIAAKTQMDSVFVTIDSAVPCGLIINELISNSLKHAFPGDRKGEITIGLCKTDNEEIELRVSDNGVGLPDGYDIRKTDSYGLQAVVNLTGHQLRGTVNLLSDKGTEFQIRFKETPYKERI